MAIVSRSGGLLWLDQGVLTLKSLNAGRRAVKGGAVHARTARGALAKLCIGFAYLKNGFYFRLLAKVAPTPQMQHFNIKML